MYHLLQTVAAIEQIFNILGHDLRNIFQLIIEPTEIVCRSAILIRLLRSLQIAIKFSVCIRSELRVKVSFALVGGLEFGSDVFEVGKGEFLWV